MRFFAWTDAQVRIVAAHGSEVFDEFEWYMRAMKVERVRGVPSQKD
ncbi:hypothetical protein RBB77_15240 [Tunturibacter psychrotolerans]|uniref:Uncharacterized protein n=1 Tax=Tunturiibacter psychrotolerans TaxID=3069686 RepID=A0AAU7ZLP0_9BACT